MCIYKCVLTCSHMPGPLWCVFLSIIFRHIDVREATTKYCSKHSTQSGGMPLCLRSERIVNNAEYIAFVLSRARCGESWLWWDQIYVPLAHGT